MSIESDALVYWFRDENQEIEFWNFYRTLASEWGEENLIVVVPTQWQPYLQHRDRWGKPSLVSAVHTANGIRIDAKFDGHIAFSSKTFWLEYKSLEKVKHD